MNQTRHSDSPAPALTRFVTGYARLLAGILALAPLLAVAYIHYQQDPVRVFEHHSFHVGAIGIAILLGAFISYVTWRCYMASGERLLRWLALGLLGFTLVYAPHGFLTHFAADNPWLFLLYGPVSRLIMAACFLIALLHYGDAADAPERRARGWGAALAGFLVLDALVALVAVSPWRAAPALRLTLEYLAIAMYVAGVGWMLLRRVRGSLMGLYAIAMLWFAQSSWAFTLGLPWNHQWWLAHLVFAAGFLLLSYGVVQAYLTTGSFTRIYSQAELMAQILAQKRRAERAMVELQQANSDLTRLAATDALTGAANRREFMSRLEQEAARARRGEQTLSLLMFDLDHFKVVNDEHGHQAGDEVLKVVADLAREVLRPSDVLGRLGGEEFAVLLPAAELDLACQVAERLRQRLEREVIRVGDAQVRITLSVGVDQLCPDADSVRDLIQRTDTRLYRAKEAGRNRVEPEPGGGRGD
ncbi:GGDEF domain-containing protein [Thiohalobacter sp. COW1]|uniref:diguanylate cyclase n=1 Tax=Thiohalobacter thiocyanaticus TaxID=585455 RepID=A0A1Z4VN97_9GAMM|nr:MULTISPECIES: sensor domain-containing diguanylate cyclase [Thiohalobacter]BAZ93077.1 diguanylate cyclase [Thiohalobacter thiocyanaticus]BCO31912.1 GGDEF domain-containing protein [Thiohalobacter sp. COW1]